MIYVTTRQKPHEKQLSWFDLIGEEEISLNDLVSGGAAGTVTRVLPEASPELLGKIDVPGMIETLKHFNETHKELFDRDRESMYRHFKIPKKSGGLRQIDAPNEELQNALELLKIILEEKFGVLYHTAGFAYVKKRCPIQAVRKHQVNESNWFYHTDASGFFPSTTLKFSMKMAGMIFPLSEICKDEEGYKELEKALSLAFLNNSLPQGTKFSPYWSNVLCIPIDHRIFNDLAHKRYVYTRYADDIHISCVQAFDKDEMTRYIESVFEEFDAPWKLKPEKTHYGSRKGRNAILGVHLNADNNITTGYKTKKLFRAMTCNLIQDYKNKKPWPADEVQQYAGLLAYYRSVEKDYYNDLINRYNNKFNVNVKSILKELQTI